MSGLFGLFSSAPVAQPASSSTMDPHAQLEARVKDMEQIAQLLKIDDPDKFAASLPDLALLQRQYGINVDLAKIMKGLDKNLMQSMGLNGNNPAEVINYVAQQIPDGEAKTRLLTTLDAASKAGAPVQDALLPFLRMRAKHQYYMYKYMQLNLFVVMYTMKMQELFRATYQGVLAAVADTQDKQKKLLDTYVETSRVLGTLPDAEKLKSMDELLKLSQGVADNIVRNNNNLSNDIKQMEQGNLAEVVKSMANNMTTPSGPFANLTAQYAQAPPPQLPVRPPPSMQQQYGATQQYPRIGATNQFNPAQQFSRLG